MLEVNNIVLNKVFQKYIRKYYKMRVKLPYYIFVCAGRAVRVSHAQCV